MAQNGPLEFNMERTYFCQGETIQFDVNTNGATGFSNVRIVGPSSSYTYPYTIPNCTSSHTGVYRLLANYQGNASYLMDEITINVIEVNVTASADNTLVSPGGGTTLHGYGADYYVWAPAQYLSDTIGESVQAIIPANIPSNVNCIDFTVTGYTSGDNRVTNGDFEQSGSCDTGYGFDSDYDCYSGANCLYPSSHEGGYSIHDNAHYIHQDFYNPGNNAGHGKFMIINGDPTQNAQYRIIWSQSIRVRPNTQYAFSADVCTFVNRNYARLQFQINGTLIGEVYTAPNSSAGWQTFYALWEGSASNIATITIVNLQTAGDGNDFGIDNISFHDLMECSALATVQVCIQREVEVGDIEVPAPICEGGTLEVSAPQVTVNEGSSSYTGHWVYGPSPGGPWQPLNSLSNIPASYDGMYLCYEVTHDNTHYYSNAVRITVIDFNVYITVTQNNDTICVGDTVVLEAVVDTIYPFAAVGDILCSDGSIVHRNDWPAPGKTAIGIVFYVDDSKWHGWAVSLTETVSMAWSTLPASFVNGHQNANWRAAISRDDEWEGYANTQRILSAGNATAYPAGWAAAGFSTTYPAPWSRGWYLPSAAQLNMLFGELHEVNLSLDRVGGATPIVDNNPGTTRPGGSVLLWSSTEGSQNSKAFALEIADGRIAEDLKASNDKYKVRAVITF